MYVQYVHTHTAVHIRETYGQCTYVRMCKYICLTYVHIRKLVFIYVHIRTVRFTDGGGAIARAGGATTSSGCEAGATTVGHSILLGNYRGENPCNLVEKSQQSLGKIPAIVT